MPCVSVTVPEETKESPSVTVIVEPFTVTAPKVLPALVMVPVAFSVMVPLYVKVIPETSVMFPDTVIAAVPAIVPVKSPEPLVQLMLFAPVLPVAMVTVFAPELASK